MEKIWTNSPGWILLRAVVLGLLAFVALQSLVATRWAVLSAIVVALVLAIDAVRGDRASP